MTDQESRKIGSIRNRSVTVLVPALNEERNIQGTIDRLLDALSLTIEDYEILIIDDGSTDSTAAIANEIVASHQSIRLLQNPGNMGLGYCYGAGYRAATKGFFVYIPGDNTWPARSLIELFGNLGRADIITSYASNPEVRPFGRRWISKLYTATINLLFSQHLRYFNGLTIYPVEFLRKEPATTFGFGFQAEVLLKALSLGLSYIEIPLPIDERTSGNSKAVNFRNITSVAVTLAKLFVEVRLGSAWKAPVTVASTAIEASHPASQIIVITGASSGIGHAMAIEMAKAGHRVYTCSRDMESLSQAFQSEPRVTCIQCDMTSQEAIDRMILKIGEHVDHVDVLINCAGGFGAIGPIFNVDSNEWLGTITTNLFSVFLSVKSFLPLLGRSSVPHVINFSGGGAFSPVTNFSAYACAKTAVVRLTETLAIELLERGIAVNAIAPGFVPTRAHEATLIAGPGLAGSLHFHRAQALVGDQSQLMIDARIRTINECVKALISVEYRGLTGKTISANFDPWSASQFRQHIGEINKSDLFTMRRINIVNLSEGMLRNVLLSARSRDGSLPSDSSTS
jgi:NAD(P)-dependent dehydrogenase (short-subunit alcohol dehydrogenase family)